MLIDCNWLCNLAFSCIASLRTNFIEISLLHNLSTALSVEELNRLGFNDGSGGVRFVYFFFSGCNLCKNSCSFNPQSYFVKVSAKFFFPSIINKFVFFNGYFEDT